MSSKKFILKISIVSMVLLLIPMVIILLCVLIILNFFGTKLTKEKVQNNVEYATEYVNVVNNYLVEGYVPLQRLLYFYLEDSSISLDTLYRINQNSNERIEKDIYDVCKDSRLENMTACTTDFIKENEEYLIVSTKRFNFPLQSNLFKVTSFFNEQRTVLNRNSIHGGWDFAVSEQTPIYSVCNGVVEKVNFIYSDNISTNDGDGYGNSITIKCDEDYDETYYVIFAHLYPNSAKVNIGDRVNHWTELAGVGTTGFSTGNHLHFQVENSNREKIDGMELIDFNLKFMS